MHTNLNMIETRTTASSFGRTNFGGIISNAALNILLASKDATAAMKFESETGWSWRDACTTAIEAGTANLLAIKTDAEIAAFEAATGWKWSDAVEEAITAEIEGEQRALRSPVTISLDSVTSESDADKFERETGWTLGDAADMAAESRRDDRFFGRRPHYLN
ncbi:hypothetical protein BH11CYA1_BH11CYA1_07970 [soil metagenome]